MTGPGIAEHFAAEWERAVRSGHDKWAPYAEPPQSWPLTDADRPLIGWGIIPDHPLWSYLADPEAGRPATGAEMAAIEEAAREEYRVGMLPKPAAPLPHPPMCGCNTLASPAAVPEPADPMAEMAAERHASTVVLPVIDATPTAAIPAVPSDGAA